MNYLIISSHPYEGSFTTSANKNIEKTLLAKGETVKYLDLVKDNFNPVMSQKDLELWGKGQTNDELVTSYMQDIKWADVLIFVFPVWWGTYPAVLKGFFDKVFLPNFAYSYDEKGTLITKLNGKKAVVVSIMASPQEYFDEVLKNPVENAFIKNTLKHCGVDVQKYFELSSMLGVTREITDKHMEEIINYFKQSK